MNPNVNAYLQLIPNTPEQKKNKNKSKVIN